MELHLRCGKVFMGETVTLHAGQQPLRALELANQVRLARAALKRRVRDGQVSVAQVVEASPWETYSMPIGELLRSQQRWGEKRARRALLPIGVPENKPIGQLTERQRLALVAALDRSGRGAREAPRTLSPV